MEGWAGRITSAVCAGTGTPVAWAQLLRANSRPEYIFPCAGNRGVADTALQGRTLPPRPSSGCPQPYVVGCPGRWLLPQWAVAPARCPWLSAELSLYGRHCGGGTDRDVKFEKKAAAGLGTWWV